MKELLIVVAGSGERKPISIGPGTTVQDVLEQTGLQGYVLSRDGDLANVLPANKDLFPLVEDGQKVWASTVADVGRRAS
jgi:sulfur carrier protein ThiS